jgi:hypothetical protein
MTSSVYDITDSLIEQNGFCGVSQQRKLFVMLCYVMLCYIHGYVIVEATLSAFSGPRALESLRMHDLCSIATATNVNQNNIYTVSCTCKFSYLSLTSLHTDPCMKCHWLQIIYEKQTRSLYIITGRLKIIIPAITHLLQKWAWTIA